MPTIPWEEVREVVDAVLDLPPNERAAYLDQACPTPSVRRYVESLVLSYEQAGDFLDEPALARHELDAACSGAGSWQSRRVGSYQIIEEIGEGGMGAVYRAQRADDQYQKQVAIKLVRSGFDTRFTVARFRAERQILASLEHPNIARLLDGGSTEDAQPYFVMEYIQGQPLDQYCNDRKLTIADRLRLFRTVCSAVQYAHQNLVIHRDIKPGNILVTGDGTPKLLDFGIAKMLGPDLAGSASVRTVTRMRLLTPEYASPEQLHGQPITTASDVYSLGVVLYELLTGRRPRRRIDRATEETASIVAEAEPEKPSTAVSRAEEDSPNRPALTPEIVSATREGSPERLRRRLSGDLDNIVLMALRQEPSRRYSSVEQFSEDIRRHLEGLPVIARPDSFAYRSSKFILRHRVGVITASLLALTLIGGVVATLREARIARAQRERAERRFNDVRKLANSLVFDIHDSIKDLPGATHAREALVRNASQYLDSLAKESGNDPSLQRELATAYERLGSVQGETFAANLGDKDGALQSYRKAQAIRENLAANGLTADRLQLAKTYRSISRIQESNDVASALQSVQKSLAIAQQLAQREPDNPQILSELAQEYTTVADFTTIAGGGDYAVSGSANAAIEEDYRRALEIDERLAQQSSDPSQLRSLAVDELYVGRHFSDAGRWDEAIAAFNKSLAIAKKEAVDPNNVEGQRDVAAFTNNLGDTYLMSGDNAAALASYQQAFRVLAAISAADPKDNDALAGTAESYLNVGNALRKIGKLADAMSSLEKGVTMQERAGATDPANVAIFRDISTGQLWMALISSGKHDNATAYRDFSQAIAMQRRFVKLNPKDMDTQVTLAGLLATFADFLRGTGQWDSALENYRESSAMGQALLSVYPDKGEMQYILAQAYLGLGRTYSARALQRSSAPEQKISDWTQAKSWIRRSSDLLHQIPYVTAVTPKGFDTIDAKQVGEALSQCDAALAKLAK